MDEKRDLVAAIDMFTGVGAVFVEIVLDYSDSKALVVRGDASPVPGHAKVDNRAKVPSNYVIARIYTILQHLFDGYMLGVAVALSLRNGRSQQPTSVGLGLNCPDCQG